MMRNEYVNSPVPSCGDVTQRTSISKQLTLRNPAMWVHVCFQSWWLPFVICYGIWFNVIDELSLSSRCIAASTSALVCCSMFNVIAVAYCKLVQCFNVRVCVVVASNLHVDVTAFNFEECVAAFCFTSMSAFSNELSVSSYTMFQFDVNHFEATIVLSELARC